jgi:hypothetical protein
MKDRGTSVTIWLLRAGWPGFNCRQGLRFILHHDVQNCSGANPRVKRPEYVCDHSPTCDEVQQAPTSPKRFCGVVYLYPSILKSRVSSVVLVTRLWTRGPKFDFWQGQKISSSPPRPDRPWDPLSFTSNGYRGLFPGDKAVVARSWIQTLLYCWV